MIKQIRRRDKSAFIFHRFIAKLFSMTTLPKTKEYFYTAEEYLEIDRAADERYEYVDGRIYAMAGESGKHGDIAMSFSSELRFQLKGSNCRVRSKDTKVRSGSLSKGSEIMKGMFSYPDIVVICGEPEYHDKFQDIILNPKAIVEILSDSTENFDRTDKFTRYRLFNPTLTDYILVSQNEPIVEHYIRQDDNSWRLYTYVGLDKSFAIESIACEIKLAEIYDLVEFSEEILAALAENLYY
jgi:Uma2 family endonuclease